MQLTPSNSSERSDDSRFRTLGPSHALLAGQVPAGARVLDVGCGWGHLGELLRARDCEVTGIELRPELAAEAEHRCAHVVRGDIESDADRESLGSGYDVIVCGDVLEHLRDPDAILRWARDVLTPDGIVLASVPNIAVWRARALVVRGHFDYEESGTFDRTHLRFFTRRTLHQLIIDTGYEIVRESFTPAEPPFPLQLRRFVSEPRLRSACQRLADRRPELFALQFVLTLRPARSSVGLASRSSSGPRGSGAIESA